MSLTQTLLAAALLVALAIAAPAQQRFAELGRWQLPAGHGAQAVAFGDVDGDGDLDLLCGNVGQNRLYLNNGGGVFTDATAAQMPVDTESTYAVVLGDVDGDGDLDLVFGNAPRIGGGQNRVYLNDGSGVFTDATAAQMPVDNNGTRSIALGDVDGDGDLDLVCGNVGDPIRQREQDRLYLNNGGGVFTDATAAQLPVRLEFTESVALGDIDGDGDLDLVCGSVLGQNWLYLNNGSGVFTDAAATQLPVDGGTASVALGDVDGDGDLDLVCGRYFHQNSLYLNDGSGVFTDATAAQMPVDNDQTLSVALGDVDGDGDLDLVFGSLSQNRLYLNLERQLHAPNPLQVGQAYQLDGYARYGQARPFDVALPYLSTMRVSIPLPPYGILGIAPMAALPPILIQQPAGVGSVTWDVPNNPALAGIAIHTQAMLIQYPVQARLTNVVTDVIL